MSSFCKVIIIGNLGRDPEVRSFQNGGRVANLSVATSEKWKDKNSGEVRERSEWHKVTIFQEPSVRYAEQYLRKGSKVMIEGKLETRKYQDQSGADRYVTEVVIRPYGGNIIGLDRPGEGSGFGGGYGGGSSSGGGVHRPGDDGGVIDGDYNRQNDLDDEIPF